LIEQQQSQPSAARNWSRLVAAELARSLRPKRDADALPFGQRASMTLLPGHLAAYRRMLDIADDGRLPLLYPQVLAMPLHLGLLADSRLPWPASGAVHVGQRVTRTRPLAVVGQLDLEVALVGWEAHRRGTLARLGTRVHSPDGICWEAESLVLFRHDTPARAPNFKPPEAPPLENARTVQLDLPAGLGRAYARVSGDWNPIHLGQISARLFGMRRSIAHGMWSLGRSLAEIGNREMLPPACKLEAWFLAPLELPQQARLHIGRGPVFVIESDSGRPALWGRVGG
jgi:hypothetical protein